MKQLLLFIAVLYVADISFAQQTSKLVIHFDFDKHDIRPVDAARLDSLFSRRLIPMVERVELYGHCDSVGNHAYNDALSERRTAQTKAYLVGKGLPENIFIKSQGFGKRRPLNENNTPEERFDNRRVELTVVWKDTDSVVTVTSPPKENKPPSLTEVIKDTATTKTGNTIILRNLQFIPGRHVPLPESEAILEELYNVMRDNPTLVIQIRGHVCCTPINEDGYDIDLRTMNLSVQRAKTVYDYLVSRNIAPTRLSFTGLGGSQKLYPLERDEFERQENRRVELKIISR
ncbi:MAG TPA: OmpA family protein [Chitinophagaceae bacterium]|nr:OmpA family protein [Chitinophagaceae bacterium]